MAQNQNSTGTVIAPSRSCAALALRALGRSLQRFAAANLMALGALILVTAALPVSPAVAGAGLKSDWVKGHSYRVRMVAGRDGEGNVLAGVEVELDPGWKTYWRNPGESGGIPPYFNWSQSKNVAETIILYPAPRRLKDALGDSIGYKDWVVLPVRVVPSDSGRPLGLDLEFSFGVCSDICIPAEAALRLEVPSGVSVGMPDSVVEALAKVPRKTSELRDGDPRIVASVVELSGAEPKIELDVGFGKDALEGDVFVEAPPGYFLPMAKRVGPADQSGVTRFRIALAGTPDLEELLGKELNVTMVGAAGQSEEAFVLKAGR